MEFSIKRSGRNTFVIWDSEGSSRTEPLTREDATKRLDAFRAAARARLINDPTAQEHRDVMRVYRQANGNPWIQALLMPPERQTYLRRINDKGRKAADEALAWWARKPPGMKPSQWVLIQNTEAASAVRGRLGDAARQQVSTLWNALSNIPSRKRSGQIAIMLNIDIRHVRRLRPR